LITRSYYWLLEYLRTSLYNFVKKIGLYERGKTGWGAVNSYNPMKGVKAQGLILIRLGLLISKLTGDRAVMASRKIQTRGLASPPFDGSALS